MPRAQRHDPPVHPLSPRAPPRPPAAHRAPRHPSKLGPNLQTAHRVPTTATDRLTVGFYHQAVATCYTSHMNKPKPPPRPSLALNVRMPLDIHATIKAQAADETRTLNGQIVHLLKFALQYYQPPQ